VFRRFGSRAGIFQALLDDDERDFQLQVLSGPPPLGPGAGAVERLVAYGRARTGFMIEHRDIARATLDGSHPPPAGGRTPMSQVHIRMLLGQLDLGRADLDMLAIQLAAALDGPVLLSLSAGDLADDSGGAAARIGQAWQDLVERACRPAA
jgi:AcrR family transcriptional regulator